MFPVLSQQVVMKLEEKQSSKSTVLHSLQCSWAIHPSIKQRLRLSLPHSESETGACREEVHLGSLSSYSLVLFKLQPVCNQAAGKPQWWLWTLHVSLLSFFLSVVHVLPATKAKDSLWSLFEGKLSYFHCVWMFQCVCCFCGGLALYRPWQTKITQPKGYTTVL